MSRFKSEQYYFVFDTIGYRYPVEFIQNRSNVSSNILQSGNGVGA